MPLHNPSPSAGSHSGVISSIPRMLVKDASVSVGTGNLRLSYFTADRTDTFTGIRVTSGAATPSGATLVRVGVYSVATNGDLTLVGSTANDTAILAAASTVYAKALSSPVTLSGGQRYAAAVLIVTAGTPASANGINMISSVDAGLDERICGFVASQTDLPSSVVVGNVANSASNVNVTLTP